MEVRGTLEFVASLPVPRSRRSSGLVHNEDGVPVCIFFFFQAEDGIRDLTVTGVQTCALPISATEPFPWFCDLEPQLAARVWAHRSREFPGSADPAAATTYASARLDWRRLDRKSVV